MACTKIYIYFCAFFEKLVLMTKILMGIGHFTNWRESKNNDKSMNFINNDIDE